MNEYKRLTITNFNADKITLNTYRGIGKSIYTRLQELEDKIESGLGFIVPCNVGDTVWYLNTTPSMTLARNTIYEGKLVRYHILNYPQPLGTCVLADIQIHNEYGTTEVPDVKDFGKRWFTDKSQAEARLKEMKGEK